MDLLCAFGFPAHEGLSMLPTIEHFLNTRAVHGDNRSVPLELLRNACATWARQRNAPFPEMGAIEAALKRRGVRIVMVGWAPVAQGIGLRRHNPAVEAMRKVAEAGRK
ncbi:hypothetical protein [Streptomyces sp. NPDC050392]|uniref:hypothetical protein n=1 Tax=Streptomyces sp. NPDC050392 TaxID=3155782 RepID=UPI00341F9871